jgi:hypothetical protein
MGKIFKNIDEFIEQHSYEIYSATALVLLINILIAIPFLRNFLHTGLVRNFIVFGSASHPGSFAQFAKYGIQWLAFVDMFILLPAIVWSMLMPSVVAYVKKIQSEEEE